MDRVYACSFPRFAFESNIYNSHSHAPPNRISHANVNDTSYAEHADLRPRSLVQDWNDCIFTIAKAGGTGSL